MSRKEDGIAKKGKTKSTGAKIDGPSVGEETGGKKSVGRSQETTKAIGRGLAKLAFLKGSK
jgi:hypothetical protein